MDIDAVFLTCVEDWAREEFDERIGYAFDAFEEWTRDLNQEEKDLLAGLLKAFHYYSRRRVVEILKDLNQKAVERYGISNQDSVISVVRKAAGVYSSSYEYWQTHRMISGLSKKIYYDSVAEIPETEWERIQKVVFVDDCSGTGRQFTKFMRSVQERGKSFAGKQVVLLVIEIMEDAARYIQEELQKQGIAVAIVAGAVRDKAFRRMPEQEIELFLAMSRRHEVDRASVKGFGDAEALMSFYHNTPNDTLGLFWFSSERNRPIFPRAADEEPGWRLKSDKAARRREQYEAKSG